MDMLSINKPPIFLIFLKIPYALGGSVAPPPPNISIYWVPSPPIANSQELEVVSGDDEEDDDNIAD